MCFYLLGAVVLKLKKSLRSNNVVKAGLGIAVLLFSAAAGSYGLQAKDAEDIHYDGRSFVYVTEDHTSFSVHLSDDTAHILLILNGARHELERTISASGARYANKDESIVFWSKGKRAFIEVDGEIVLRGVTDE